MIPSCDFRVTAGCNNRSGTPTNTKRAFLRGWDEHVKPPLFVGGQRIKLKKNRRHFIVLVLSPQEIGSTGLLGLQPRRARYYLANSYFPSTSRKSLLRSAPATEIGAILWPSFSAAIITSSALVCDP